MYCRRMTDDFPFRAAIGLEPWTTKGLKGRERVFKKTFSPPFFEKQKTFVPPT